MSRPRINLLPYRQEKRARKLREFNTMMVFAAFAGVAIVFFAWKWFDNRIEAQQDRNQFLTSEIAKLDKQIQEIDKLREEIRQAVERKKTVETLQANRSQAVHLLDQMVHQLPEGLYLQSLKQKGNTVTVVGYAQSNAHVSAFMRNIEASRWLDNARLVEIKLTEIKEDRQAPGRGVVVKRGTTVNEFTLNFDVKTVTAEARKPAGQSGGTI
ncbi:MAG: PilN domain-containing protein [Proteobacteria bacterium]|nr:PilN domain-containing protein [Pseudomonadota bacterium]MCL2307211.1 PilN domain-containing protein [Pseudomonadota bacterium]